MTVAEESEQMFPLHEAVASGNFEEVKRIVEFGGHVNDLHYGGTTPLHMACLAGHYHIALYLIEKGAIIDAYTLERSTPLCEASAGGHTHIVELLLHHGAAINPILLLSSPLHEAALRGHADVVDVLLAYGADVTCNDSHHGTPLHTACSKRQPNSRIIRSLLQAGSNPNCLQYHRTPLHLIAMNSQCVESAAALLEYGADIYMRDTQNRRPVDLVASHTPLHALLVSAAADPMPLLLLCRLAVRQSLGRHGIRRLHLLPLPQPFIKFLS